MMFILYILLCLSLVLLLLFLFNFFFVMDTPSFRVFYRTIGRDLRGAILFLKIHGFYYYSYIRNYTIVDYFNKNVAKIPNEICFIYEDEEWTYKQVDNLSNKVAHFFINQDFVKGDKVALLMDNCPDYVCIWLGLGKIGIVTSLINTNLKAESLAHCINTVDVKAVIFGQNFIEAVESALPYIKKLENIYCYQRKWGSKESLPSFCSSFNYCLENICPTPLDLRKFKTNIKDELLYIYTSGTTGLPKAAIYKHTRCIYLVAASKYILQANGCHQFNVYNCLPLYHSSGGMLCLSAVLVFGGKIVLRKKFSASNFWKDAVKHKVTVCQYIGEICRYLLNQPSVPEETQHSIQIMYGNGLQPHIWEEFQDRFKIEKIVELYGSTEGNASIVNIFGKSGACGFVSRIFFRIYSVHLIKINPETGNFVRDSNGLCIRCKPGEPGELVARIAGISPTMSFDGYVNSADTEKKIVKDCFRKGDKAFCSGDILVMDEDGYLYFKDRTGDTFRWKGENVSTTEVENVISKVMNHVPCIVFGVEIPNTEGRAGMALIETDVRNVDLKQFYEAISRQLPPYAVPLFVRFSKDIDVTGTYKFRKSKFKDEGYNLEKVNDPLYVLDFLEKTYVPLSSEKYSDIIFGKIKL